MRSLWVGLVVFALLPSAAAKEVPVVQGATTVAPTDVDTTLYFHLLGIQDFPINTQRPDPDWIETASWGLTTSTLSCAGGATGSSVGGLQQAYHTWRGFSSPSFVEYDFTENGNPRVHPERGLAAPVIVAKDPAPVLTWYLVESSSLAPTGPGAPLPNVVVQATVRSGDPLSVDDKAYDTGPVLLDGRTDPVTLVAGKAYGPDGQPSSQVHGEQLASLNVYEFRVPLEVVLDTIPMGTGFTLRIDAFLDNPVCNEPSVTGSMMPNALDPYLDADHLPRLQLQHAPALLPTFGPDVQALQENGSRRLLVHWGLNSPWGNYDVDVGQARLQVHGPAEAHFALHSVVQRTHEVYHHLDPPSFVWAWDLAAHPPVDGLYTAVVTAPNLQGTATAEGIVQFRIVDGRLAAGPAQQLPGPGLAYVAVGLLGAVAIGLSRRPQA